VYFSLFFGKVGSLFLKGCPGFHETKHELQSPQPQRDECAALEEVDEVSVVRGLLKPAAHPEPAKIMSGLQSV
jgi:hypothetical protein